MTVHLAKGARDALPAQMHLRNQVTATIATVFRNHGFEPLDTPAFERIETLTGKYGEEGQQLIFKILKRGEGGERGECDLALRYDLTVPLARVIAMHPELRLPFKRSHMAPVWRADRPAKGRFREFWQCDADIVGAEGPLAEAECLATAHEALLALGFDRFTLRLNDRRILRAMASAVGAADQEGALLVAIDKLDKIGIDGVSAELRQRGFGDAQLATLWELLAPAGDDEVTLDLLATALAEQPQVAEAVATLRAVRAGAIGLGVDPTRLKIDPTLARGLDYYTGPVYEGVITDGDVGSVCGGGRYDGLIGMFSGRDVPAVGISLGLERLLTLLEERRGEVPETLAQVLVCPADPGATEHALAVTRTLRAAGLAVDLYVGEPKLKPQLKYGNARGYPFLAIIGAREAAAGAIALKNMVDGSQVTVDAPEAARVIAAATAR